MSKWRNRIVGEITYEDPEQLLGHHANARRHPGRQRDALESVLDEVGWVSTCIVNDTTGNVVDGHMRCEQAITAGEQVPVLHVELTAAEELEVLATLDPIGAMAKYDRERLDDLVDSVRTDSAVLDEMLESMRTTAPIMPEYDDLDAPVFDPLPETKFLTLSFEDGYRYDDVMAELAAMPGTNNADKIWRRITGEA
jgi:hypothetical protein